MVVYTRWEIDGAHLSLGRNQQAYLMADEQLVDAIEHSRQTDGSLPQGGRYRVDVAELGDEQLLLRVSTRASTPSTSTTSSLRRRRPLRQLHSLLVLVAGRQQVQPEEIETNVYV